MWFFNSFVKSLYDLNWLRARRGELGKAFSYFFLFIFFVSGLYFTPLIVGMMRGDGVAQAKTALNEKIPDFTATVAGGELSIAGVEQPYVFYDKEFVFVVDTASTSTMTLDSYFKDDVNSGVLVNRYGFEAYDAEQGQSRSQSFKNFGDFSFDRANLINIANKFLSKPALFIYSLVAFFFMYAGTVIRKLLLVLLAALLVLLIAKLAKKNWKYKNILSVGLFALTLPNIALILIGLLPLTPGWTTVMLLPLVLLTCWLGVVVFSEKSETPATEVKPQQ